MKKIVSLLLATMLFFSCVSSDIRYANIAAENNNYVTALSYLEKYLYKPEKNVDVKILAQYQILWNKGRDYYATIIRSEEHTSELQSRQYLVCRLLLEKKKLTQR